jgi:hypothetical protein
MSDTIEVKGITFTKEKPTKAGYYLTAEVVPNATWVHAVTVEPEYDDSTKLGCWTMQWKPVCELDYYWHRLVPEQELAAMTAERDKWKRLASSAEQYARDFAARNPKHAWRGVQQDPWGVHQWIEEIDRLNAKDGQ